MIFTIPARFSFAPFLIVLIAGLASCTSSGTTDQDAESRYHIRSEFTGVDQILAIERASDGSNLIVFNPFESGDLDSEWVVSPVGDDFYRFNNRGLGETLSLDIINDGVFDKLTLAPSDDVSGQRWLITSLENGYCRITSELLGSEMALDITSDTAQPGLTIRPAGEFSGQNWSLSQIGMEGILDSICPGAD